MENKKQLHVSIGNINIDFISFINKKIKIDSSIESKDVWIGLGGAATNYAIAVSRLNHASKLIARTGKEIIKLGFLDKLKEEGVDISDIKITKEKPGVVMIIVNRRNSTRTMISSINANKRLDLKDIKIVGDHIHFSSINPRLLKYCNDIRKINGKDVTISYDPGGEACYNKEIINNLHLIDWLLINEKEFSCLNLKNKLNELFDNRLKFVVIKKGSLGAEILEKNKKISAKINLNIKQLDPTGAGDAFDASYNVFFKETNDEELALKFAIASGSSKVEKIGSSNMPYLYEINPKIKFVETFHH
ncbi:sugar kinase, ribokinase [Caldisphaera lagunensis DSM 15908]|uniref:Sugar kinase, ribokinase n=1 Tax=Caldisphaera lagunensis (strain DSM 15908 / JCM 11604 / ANMR 0165 / IC-154) TaxID=1056495 RepID=L0ABY6_CALLD|nr:PfkB family carbohydrate kinase [Caldisphaera lagunensis]AFZ70627.1 sugar kinase, ribokinase [Caldisphaera lagunensis DSM 15908]